MPGERLAIRMTGSNLGVVDLFQGSELLARVVNPLDGVVPADFYVYSAKNAEPPRAVALDAQGNRIEVAGSPGGVVVPKPPADGGTEGGPMTSFTKTCRGFNDVTAVSPDAGAICGPSGALVTLAVRNATGGILDVYGTSFDAGVCKTLPLARLAVGETRAISPVFDNQTLTLQKEDTTLVARLRIAPGEAGPCNLLVE